VNHLLPLAILLAAPILAPAAEPTVAPANPAPAAPAQVDYLRDIKSVFKERCFACHGALKQESGLRLDTAAFMAKGGDSGPAIVPRNLDDSYLLERITDPNAGSRMPPEGMPLTPQQIAAIRAWIEQGAPAPEDEQPEKDPRLHWAFQPPVRAPLPTLNQLEPTGHPIDAFILAQLEARGLTPRPLADRSLQLRRLYLDLIGLPPTREELHAFLADTSPTAWEAAVDRLLADPRYGERWARHWMDIWRYSDWYGRRHVPDVWNSAPQIWRWRDWIVQSLNDDHGYDRMLREMLAADEICPDNDQAVVATGYLVRNWYALNPNDWMRNTVEHTGKAFLGLTFNCAHCHDHKYDPISQDNYFQFRAFFEPMGMRQDRVAGQADPGLFEEYSYGKLRTIQRLGAIRIFDKTFDAPTWFYTGGDERNRVTERGSIAPAFPELLANPSIQIRPVELPPPAWYPGLRPGIQETILNEARAALARAEAEHTAAQQTVVEVPADVRERIAQAEAAYEAARKAAEESGQPGALSGRQSLQLDASQGRRVLSNTLPGLKTLDDGATFEFQVLLLKDAHFNLQFAKDHVKGLTALFVGFDQGRILAYQPGSFTEFDAGRYDFAAGQKRFHVRLVLETQADRALLTVRSLTDDKTLVDAAPIALNGWNPVNDPTKGFSFDARTGSVVVVDDVFLTAPASTATEAAPAARLASFDFEAPAFTEGRDVAGLAGWAASPFGSAPASSVVSAFAANESLRALAQQVETGRRALRVPELKQQSAAARLVAARATLDGIEARIAADRAQHGESTSVDLTPLIQAASRLEREAVVKSTAAEVLSQELALAVAESKPESDANRAKELDAASKALAVARDASAKAQATLADANLANKYTPFSPTYPKTSTGRRRALAEWITARQNPLTARVAVNHIWARHFHQPIVATVADFGRNGAPPTHPELLDWLAVELMDANWSMKHLHRLIVTSTAYRRVASSGPESPNTSADPENLLLWRMNPGRMEAEVVRDSLLYVAGKLDTQRGGQELENAEALKTFRRSLYYSIHPEGDGKNELAALFDAPDPLDCYRRTRSIVPQQALALTNSDLVHQMAGFVAAAVWAEVATAPASSSSPQAPVPEQTDRFIHAAFEKLLARAPTNAELTACREFLTQQVTLLTEAKTASPDVRARDSLIRALLNHNDFITIR